MRHLRGTPRRHRWQRLRRARRQDRGGVMSAPASHVLKNPAGTYSVVGRVPETCLAVTTPPTRDQVMGGRWFERDGKNYGWNGRAFPTWQAAADAVLEGGGTLCECCHEEAA